MRLIAFTEDMKKCESEILKLLAKYNFTNSEGKVVLNEVVECLDDNSVILVSNKEKWGRSLEFENSKKLKLLVCMDTEFTDCIVEKIKNPFSDEHTFVKVIEKGRTYYLNLDYVIFYEL